MKKTLIVKICLLTAGFLVGGCWATKGDVQKGLTNTKAGITEEQNKQTDVKIAQNLKKIEAINTKIDNEIILKITDIQTKLYNNNQDFHRLVDEHIAELKKEIEELKSRINVLETGTKK